MSAFFNNVSVYRGTIHQDALCGGNTTNGLIQLTTRELSRDFGAQVRPSSTTFSQAAATFA